MPPPAGRSTGRSDCRRVGLHQSMGAHDDPEGERGLAGRGPRWDRRADVAVGRAEEHPYSFKTRFEDSPGTNPEELLAAAHAGCFTMALAFAIQREGFTPQELNTEAAVSLDPDGAGFKITRSALTLRAKVPGLSEAKFKELAETAEKTARCRGCSTRR